jgi:hypothetical protein
MEFKEATKSLTLKARRRRCSKLKLVVAVPSLLCFFFFWSHHRRVIFQTMMDEPTMDAKLDVAPIQKRP